MRYLVRGMILGTSLVLASAAGAQRQAPPADNPDIVVTGTRNMEQQVRDFVGALTQAPPRGQLSRFEREVCPATFGITRTGKEAVARRMRRVATAAGISVAGANCIPNVLVLVTEDKRAFLQALQRRHPYFFEALTRSEMRRLMEEPGRAAAWQLQGRPLDGDGVEIPLEQGFLANRTTRTASRITAAARPQFQASAVVVERGALEGLTTTQLADYAAMRVFARTDPSRLEASAAPTILKVLDAPMGTAVPITLTEWDLGFLKGLYASQGNLYAPSQRSAIQKQLARELEQPETDAK